MADFEQSIAGVIDALHIARDLSVSWFGERVASVDALVRRAAGPEGARARCVEGVSTLLYESYYSTGGAVPRDPPPKAFPAGAAEFTAELSRSNRSEGAWQPGWVVRAVAPELAIERDGLRLRTTPSRVRPSETLREGAAVDAQLPNERLYLSPGFYMAMGSADDSPNSLHEDPIHTLGAADSRWVKRQNRILDTWIS